MEHLRRASEVIVQYPTRDFDYTCIGGGGNGGAGSSADGMCGGGDGGGGSMPSSYGAYSIIVTAHESPRFAKCDYCGLHGPLGRCDGCGAPNRPIAATASHTGRG